MKTRSQFTYGLLIALAFACLARADFEPIPLTADSYNQDVVIEKTAPPPVVPVTTASMEGGISNSGFTWFERGYLPEWPATGLPEAGSVLTSDHDPYHQYQMPLSYQSNNAVLIDQVLSNCVVIPTPATNCCALSFLTSSGGIRNIIQYQVHYGDGGTETGNFVSRNWYNDGDPAWAANGCVNTATFVRADLNSYNPRLYSADIILSNVAGPITSIDLSLASGSGHTAIFAISGAPSPGDAFVPLAISGYNEDLVVEASAIKPGFMDRNTTATMDDGAANTRFTWYEKGYCPLAPETGLPEAGSPLTSEFDPSHDFLMPPSYTNANAVLIDAASGQSALSLLTPKSYPVLSFLTASAHGPVTNRCVISHADGTWETNTFVSPDWLTGNSQIAFRARGRVSISTKQTDSLNTDSPKLYAVDVPLARSNSAVTQIEMSFGGAGAAGAHAIVFAVSGGVPGATPTPPTLVIIRSQDGQVTLRSTQPGRLQSCTALPAGLNSWKDEGSISQTLTLAVPAEKARFYRVVAQ